MREVLRELAKQLCSGEPRSGQDLAQQLGVSRSTIWNAIKELEQLGLDIYAVRGKGYRLAQPLELLDRDSIVRKLSGLARHYADAIHVLWQTESTNAFLLQQLPNTGICVAESQSQGRGRRGRQWISPLGGNIYLSQSWTYACGPMALQGLSLACAVAIVRALAEIGVQGMGLKWPNDIQLQGAKLAGLLLEIQGESAGPCSVVVGVGLNVTMSERAAIGIDQAWVGLSDHQRLNQLDSHDQTLSRNQLAALMINHITQVLHGFDQTGLASCIEDWRKYDRYVGKSVSLQLGSEQSIEGVYKGIDAQGCLLLEQAGTTRSYAGGEVSLRLQQGES